MANNRKKAGPSAGDATGRAKAKLEAEQAQASLDRQNELTMINQQRAVEEMEGVFDPSNGAKLAEDGDGAEATPTDEVTTVDSDEVVDLGSGPKDQAPSQPPTAVTEVEDVGVEIAEQEFVVIRVNETLPNVTIGAGTLYNFDEGKKYRVPRHVAAHLEEKGYVWH